MIRAAPKSRYIEVSAAVDRVGRAVSLHLEAGRYGVAREVLDRAILERERPAGAGLTDANSSIRELPLSPRTLNRLEAQGFRTIGDVADTLDRQLARIPGIGATTIAQIRFAMKRALA